MSSVRIKCKLKETALQLFNKIWNAITPDTAGAFPYPDFLAFDDNFPLLNAFFEANPVITEQEKADIISRCFIRARRAGEQDFDRFIASVDGEVGAILARPEQLFFLTTTVSFRRDSVYPVLSLRVNQTRTSISRRYPRKIRREGFSVDGFGRVELGVPAAYACLYAQTRARTRVQAARAMLADVGLLIGCMNLFFSRRRIIVRPGPLRPLNRVRLGRFQLIHDETGNVDREQIWYEPDYKDEPSMPSLDENRVKVEKYVSAFFLQLHRSSLRTLIEPALRQYDAALSRSDPNQSLIQLWSSLEILMQSAAGGSKETAKRASFFSNEAILRRDKLEHIANARNDYVHAGNEITLAEKLVDDLRGYIRQIIEHMVFTKTKYRGRDEFRQVLNLPADPAQIRSRIAIARRGLRLRG